MQFEIIAHRGLWAGIPADLNCQARKANQYSRGAIEGAFKLGFGVETDLFPSADNRVQVSVGPAPCNFYLKDVLELRIALASVGHLNTIVLDPKMGQLRAAMVTELEGADPESLVVINVQNPSDAVWFGEKTPVFNGRTYRLYSDLDPFMLGQEATRLYTISGGVLLEQFEPSDEVSIATVLGAAQHLANGKEVMITSPDLFGWGMSAGGGRQPFMKVWSEYLAVLQDLGGQYPGGKVKLFTNLPQLASEQFEPLMG